MSNMRKFIVPTKMSATPAAFSFEAMLQQQGKQPSQPSQPGSPTVEDTTPAPQTPSSSKAAGNATKETSPSTGDSTPASTTSSTGLVKMCGYLKKKRNKMGGWRKLFFILQNQLLLSYSSREDYEKKLAPFKDIINLVPGTIIIPTTGPRFTIETNSKIMYTFRCDDHRSCSEWITALLDSLTVANGATDRNRSFHRSTLPLSSFSSPSRCEPFFGALGRTKEEPPMQHQPEQKRAGPMKPPRLGVPAVDGRPRTRAAIVATTDDHNNNVQTVHSNVKVNLASPSLSNTREDDDDGVPGAGVVQPRPISLPAPEPAEDDDEAAGDARQIFRLHQDAWRTPAAHQSLDVCRINSMFSSASAIHPDRISEDECGSSVTTCDFPPSLDHVYEDIRPPDTCPPDFGPEPIYAVVDVHAKRSRRLARLLYPEGPGESATATTTLGHPRQVSLSLPQISDGAERSVSVPRRAVTARSCSNYDDYEDVNFLADGAGSVDADGSHELIADVQSYYGQEHIYEPILVADNRLPSVTTGSSSSLPARSDHSTGNNLWRQLKRLHLEGSWRRLTLRNTDQTSVTGTPPSPQQQQQQTGTVLEGLGRRLDSHRRSIKKRIKNLRDRIDLSTVQTPPKPSAAIEPEPDQSPTNDGGPSRKSISLDSFLRAKSPPTDTTTATPLC